MSRYKALVGFAGQISMYEGEERELPDNAEVKSLVRCKYLRKIKDINSNNVVIDEGIINEN